MHAPRRSWARVGGDTLSAPERLHRAARRRELRRLRGHFAETLSWLHKRDVSTLDAPRQRARRGHLAALEAYALLGRFPRNEDRPDRFGPIFVDAAGRRCAMGHLIERAGGGSLVERVRRTANLAYIDELASDVELVAWLDGAGLTAEEAARIQPGYWCTPAELCFCQAWLFSNEAIYEGVVEDIEGGSGGGGATPVSVTYRIEQVHGPGTALIGDVVTSGDPGDLVPVAVGERFLLGDTFYPFYSFIDAETLDTTLCERAMGDADILPDTAPLLPAIVNMLHAVQCGEGLPEAWNVEYNDCTDPTGAGGAGGSPSTSTSSATSAIAATSSSSSSSAASGASSTSTVASVAGTGGAASSGEGGGGGSTTSSGDAAPGGSSGGCGSCGVASDPGASTGAALVLTAAIGSAWLRRRRRPLRAAARTRWSRGDQAR